MMNHEDYICNRDKVEERIGLVRNSLYGYDTPLSEYVCEKKGVLSDKKIEALADRLIGIMVSYGRERYPRYGRGFFEDLDRSYEILAGHRIGDEMTEEELREIWDRHEVGKKRILEKYDHLCLRDEYRELRESTNREYAAIDYEEGLAWGETNANEDAGVRLSFRILTEKEQEASGSKEIREIEEWKDSLKDQEKFIEAYKEFRRLFFSTGFDRDGLEEAIIHFLCNEGRTGLTDNEKFLRVYIQLDKAYRIAGKRVKRRT